MSAPRSAFATQSSVCLAGRPAPFCRTAFTLIELLVVVAIIVILAAIAVPNFLEAQARSKVGREMSDLRSLALALETYNVDYNRYPPYGEVLASGQVNMPATESGITTIEFAPGWPITTPVAYLASVPEDPFMIKLQDPHLRRYGYIQTRQMAAILKTKGRVAQAEGIAPRYGAWRLYGAGPDGDKGRDAKTGVLYDPTNGTISDGDLVRSQNQPNERLSQDEH